MSFSVDPPKSADLADELLVKLRAFFSADCEQSSAISAIGTPCALTIGEGERKDPPGGLR